MGLIALDSLEFLKGSSKYIYTDIGRISTNADLSIELGHSFDFDKFKLNIKDFINNFKLNNIKLFYKQDISYESLINVVSYIRTDLNIDKIVLITNEKFLSNIDKEIGLKLFNINTGITSIEIGRTQFSSVYTYSLLSGIFKSFKYINSKLNIIIRYLLEYAPDTDINLPVIVKSINKMAKYCDLIKISNENFIDFYPENFLNEPKHLREEKDYDKIISQILLYFINDYSLLNLSDKDENSQHFLIPFNIPILIDFIKSNTSLNEIKDDKTLNKINSFKYNSDNKISFDWKH